MDDIGPSLPGLHPKFSAIALPFQVYSPGAVQYCIEIGEISETLHSTHSPDSWSKVLELGTRLKVKQKIDFCEA